MIPTIELINFFTKCTYCGQYGHFTIKRFKNLQQERYKGKSVNLTGGKKCQFHDMNAVEAEEFKQLKAWLEIQGKYGSNSPLSHKGEY